MRKKIPVPAPIKKRASRDLFRIMFTTLVPLFRDFEYHHGEATKLFKTHPDGLHRAFFLAKLHRLASVAWMVNTTVCRASIVKTMDNYEQSLFAGFEVAYNAKNVAEMQRTAQICALLNGGMGCVQTYITKHPVFYDTRLNPSLLITTPPLALQLLTARGWDLSDQFVAHMSRLEAMCVQDLQMMAVIFVPQVNAGTKFITKVMDDAVSDYLEVTLRQAQQSENTEVFLHTTAACIHACSTFLEAVIHAVPDRPPGVPGAVRVDSIKRNLHGMLLPFIAEHLTLEINYLLQRYDRVIKAWEIKQNEEREERKLRALNEKLSGAAFLKTREAARAHKNKALETIRTILFAPLALGRTVVSALGVIDDGPKKTVSPFVEFGITDTLTGETLQSNLSLDLCMNFVQHNREALGRVLVVTAAFHAPRLRDNVEAVFVPVLNTIAQHVEIGFKRALGTMQAIPAPSRGATSIDNPEARDAAERATLEFFEMIHLGDVIQQMLDVYYSQDVQPWVNSQDFLAPHVASKKAFERRLDAHVAAGMEYSLQVTAVQVEILLNKQPADDYNSKAPPAELALVAPPVVDVVTTKTTQAVIQLLSRYGKLLEGALDNSSLTISLTELGTRVTTLVVDHLKTLVISQSGALVLIADLNAYYEWASCFHLPSLRQELNALKELGNLFLAEDATGLADMRQAIVRAGRWRIEDLQDLLRQRADWSKISKQLDGKECCIQ
ncbi:hypothetical protein CXG81DRAFT_10968 [Caulochytrium protostelioides]|uniref:Exocyst complex component Sec10-like alpha-helical bundle domain-containing protein n=1 Tax=Caulochytrium protostelioides TaxID=1555241 RepID=A0A4P9XAE5_9FUNG|nr:hypothetical protein CXG81DRAFT_10968 [Caulochytrium protostelioides]|eukprot:RKP02295.1 hypothetical protein CXG81DRAFT_10968 [Caulochytrium protostelioides]